MKTMLKMGVLIILPVILLLGCQKEEIVTALFSASETEIERGATVYFTNESENASYYQWDFGDGNQSYDESPSHEFTQAGTFDVTLVAIGSDNTDTASVSIIVNPDYDITIFEGTGIENVDLYDSWADVKALYSLDTLHYIYDYTEDYGYYNHLVYFYNEGIICHFFTETTTLSDDDPVYFIWVVYPFEGATSKGITIGSDFGEVEESYGEYEDIYESDDYYGYWYDSKGVDFYTYNSGEVDEIDIYEAVKSASLAAKNAVLQKVIKEHKNPFLKK